MSSFPVSRADLQNMERLAREKKRHDYIEAFKKKIHDQVSTLATSGKETFYTFYLNDNRSFPESGLTDAILYRGEVNPKNVSLGNRQVSLSTVETEFVLKTLESTLNDMYPDVTISVVDPTTYVYPPYMDQLSKTLSRQQGPYIVIDWS